MQRYLRDKPLVMRYAGLRISDVVTLSRDHIYGTRLEKRAIKNKRMAFGLSCPASSSKRSKCYSRQKVLREDNRRYFSKDTANLRSLVKGMAHHVRGL